MSHNFIPEHFSIEELIPPVPLLPAPMQKAYAADPKSLFRCFDLLALVTLERLRERYGPCVVNNWKAFSKEDALDFSKSYIFRFSGFRPWECEEGATLSEHRMFRAFDAKFKNVTPAEIWADMQKDINLRVFEVIQRIEAFEGMTWYHFDVGQHERYAKAVRVIPHRGNRAGLPEYIERG